jgi:hypothetical protein
MDANKDMGQELPHRQLAASLGVLTSLVLLCVAGILAMDLVAHLGVAPTSAAPIAPAVAKSAASAETPWMTFVGRTILTVTIIVALAIIAPMVGALCLFGLLRRYGKHLGPLIHVEHASPPPVMVGPFTAGSLGIAGAAASTPQPLNMGPTFEEDRLRKTELTSRMEAAVLGQLLEDNVKLQAKIEVFRNQGKATAADVSGARFLSKVDA